MCKASKTPFWRTILFLICVFSCRCYGFTVAETVTTMKARGTLQGAEAEKIRNRNRDSKQQPRQKTVVSASQITSILNEIFKNVNEGFRPDSMTIASAEGLVKGNKRNLKDMNDGDKCRHFMLSAWTSYFQGNLPNALKAASNAYRANRHNADACITQAALAILADKKPQTLPKERKTKEGSVSTPTGGSDKLNLNVDDIKKDMLGIALQPVQLNCLNSTIFAQYPGQTNLCLLLWQMDPSEKQILSVNVEGIRRPGEPNSLSLRAVANPVQPSMLMPEIPGEPRRSGMPREPRRSGMPREPRRPEMPRESRRSEMPRESRRSGMPREPGRSGMPRGLRQSEMPGMMPYMPGMPRMGQMPSASNVNSGTFEDQIGAFGQLAKTAARRPGCGLQFAAINLDPPASRDVIIEKIFENPWPWANVMANDPSSGAGQFAKFSVDTEKPILIITRKDNTVKYAGPATGFLAAMVVENLMGTSRDAPSVNFAELQRQMKNMKLPNQLTPQIMPNMPNPGQQPEDDDVIMSETAKKLLGDANTLIEIGKFTTNYRQGIEKCREVIKSYPNTKYADQGRQLLRKVPERYRKRYNVTNEEMGL